MAGRFAVDADANGVAVKGHDPVAYFADEETTMGNVSHIARFDGAVYYFASADNRAQFVADPAKYAPAYGGFCALDSTRSMKITGDPAAWKIADNALYLNSSLQALSTWSEDIAGNINKANEVWPVIKDTDPADL